MLEIVVESDQISRAMAHFHKEFVDASDHAVTTTVGFHGGGVTATVYEFHRLGYWYCPRDFGADFNRYWNAFGSETPHTKASIPIDVEINFPKDGISRNIAGAFAVDHATGALFVVHRGKIGGGRKGVSKSAFWDHFRGKSVVVRDGDRATRVAVIGSLGSPRFVAQIVDFVAEVKRIKSLVTGRDPNGGTDSSDDLEELPTFNPEFAGSKSFAMPSFVDAECDHGLVVNHLAVIVEKAGYKIANDRHRDLLIIGPSGEVSALFEVKTDDSLASIQQGLGQLMLHGRALDTNTQLVLVGPHSIDEEIASRLKALGIHLARYSWALDVPQFLDLDELLGVSMVC